jgi:hypothetical protein
MRKLCALLLLCLLCVTPIASQTKTDKDRDDLVGPVKRVEAYLIEFVTKDNQIVENKRRWHITTYNTEGNIAEKTTYDQNNAITARYLHTYDENGRSTGYEEYAALLDKTLTIPRRHVYRLNAAGRKVEYTVFESNGSVGTRFVYKYDAKGNLIADQWYAHTGRLGGRTVYTVDENGNQTSQTSYQENDALNWKNISKYDANGNKTELLQYHGNTLRYKILNSYDSQGRILEKETIEFNSPPGTLRTTHAPEPGKMVYTYDDEKRTKEVATYKVDGTLQEKLAYAYDERKNEIGATVFNVDGSLKNGETRLTNIEYDSHGNWTRKTHLRQSEKGGQPQAYYAQLRVITYY